MTNRRYLLSLIFVFVIFCALAMPVLAVDYTPGVAVGQYVKYGNFAGTGQGFEVFSDYAFLQLQVTAISGKDVTLLSTGQFQNGTALPGSGTSQVWNIDAGTADGTPSTQGPIIAANLNQGDAIPPPGTYFVNQSESRTYLGFSRTVNVLTVDISTPDYNSTLTYVYDMASGMLLESSGQTTFNSQPQPVTASYSYSVVETNIFSSSSTSTDNLLIVAVVAVVVVIVIVVVVVVLIRRRK